jgi:acyl-CoA thioester hydrolase
MARQEFRFAHRLRVRWAEVDRQGIVFNGHYLTYFDVGITEYYRALGFPYPDGLAPHGTDLYVRKSAPLPDFLRNAIKAFERTAPAELNSAPA